MLYSIGIEKVIGMNDRQLIFQQRIKHKHAVKCIIGLILLIVVIILGINRRQLPSVENSKVIGLSVGNRAPDFQTTTETGDVISLSNLRGKAVLVNFWATWCAPCRIEMPAFQQLFDQYADKGFVIVAVNNAEAVEDVIHFRNQLDLTFPLAMDRQGVIQDQFGILMYPTTFVLDQDGIIVARYYGTLTHTQIEEVITLFFD